MWKTACFQDALTCSPGTNSSCNEQGNSMGVSCTSAEFMLCPTYAVPKCAPFALQLPQATQCHIDCLWIFC